MRTVIGMSGQWCTRAWSREHFAKLVVFNEKFGQTQHRGAAVLQGFGTHSLPLALETKALSCFCEMSHHCSTKVNLYLVRALVYH